LINEQLKTRTLEVNGQPVNLFDLDKNGKLVPMPQATHCMEVTIGEIVRQLGNWNIQTRQNGDIKTAQGGFDFSVGNQRTIRAPDVSFTPKAVSRQLTELQRWAFQGQPFTPTFVVEVGDTQSSTSALGELDDKFKREYFAVGTSVQLGWLIDPKNRIIWVYKRNQHGNVYRRERVWEDVEGGDVLPRFTLEVRMIEEAISQLWITAVKQGQKSGVSQWVGSSSIIKGHKPTYYFPYNSSLTIKDKVSQVMGWLDLSLNERPTFIATYARNVDLEGHRSGPYSANLNNALSYVDNMTHALLEGLVQRNLSDIVNVIIVSDHGMAQTIPSNIVKLDNSFDVSKIRPVDGYPLAGIRPYNDSDFVEIFSGLKYASYNQPWDTNLLYSTDGLGVNNE
ncbi:11303_t:CDS:2, partial [Acaulospora colombiana]